MAVHENDLAIDLLKRVLRQELADSFKKTVKELDKLCQFGTLEELQEHAEKQLSQQSALQTLTGKKNSLYQFLAGRGSKEKFSSIEDLLVKLRIYQVNESYLISDVSREDIKVFFQNKILSQEKSVQNDTPGKLKEISVLLETRIEIGTSGEVYKAMAQIDKSKSTVVAVKIFNENDKEIAQNEIYFFNRLNSPYIVNCFGLYKGVNLVFEWMANGDLGDYIDGNQHCMPSLSEKLTFIKDIASGLSYLHNLSIVHKDLKLENIFVKKDKGKTYLKIGDFGLSKHEGNSSDLCGTGGYLPPEILEAPSHLACRKSDIYSFSMLMLLIIYWQDQLQFPVLVLGPATSEAMLMAICRYTLDGGRPINKDPQVIVPLEIRRLIRQSWSQEPEQRPDAVKIIEEVSKQLKLR